jgi:hypothetical protein
LMRGMFSTIAFHLFGGTTAVSSQN